MLIRERVSYLKGLADGMQISEATNEGKLLRAIIEVLDDIALEMDYLQETQDEMSEQIESIDEDLAELETIVFEDYDEDEEDDEDYIGDMECPHCKEDFEIYGDMLEDGYIIECPVCYGEIELDFEECCCEECTDGDEEE